MRSTALRRIWRVSGCLLLLTPAACSKATPGCGSVIEAMKALGDTASKVRYYESLVELLPNTKFRVGTAAPRALSESVVVGRFVSVERGRAYFTPGDEAPRTTEDEFDDRRVAWRTVHGELEVEQTVAGQSLGRVTVGLAFGPAPDFRVIERCLPHLGRVLLFLNKSAVFDYDPSVFGTVDDGSLLGLVSDEDGISLPLAEDPGRLLDGATTVAQLVEAAKRPERMIHVDASGQRHTATSCLPERLELSRTRVRAGDTVRVSSRPAQCMPYSEGATYRAVLLFVGRADPAVLGDVPVARDGSFTVDFEIPRSASPGEAAIKMEGSAHDGACVRSAAASCATYLVPFEILVRG